MSFHLDSNAIQQNSNEAFEEWKKEKDKHGLIAAIRASRQVQDSGIPFEIPSSMKAIELVNLAKSFIPMIAAANDIPKKLVEHFLNAAEHLANVLDQSQQIKLDTVKNAFYELELRKAQLEAVSKNQEDNPDALLEAQFNLSNAKVQLKRHSSLELTKFNTEFGRFVDLFAKYAEKNPEAIFAFFAAVKDKLPTGLKEANSNFDDLANDDKPTKQELDVYEDEVKAKKLSLIHI